MKVLPGLCATLSVLEALEEVAAPTYLYAFVPLLTKVVWSA